MLDKSALAVLPLFLSACVADGERHESPALGTDEQALTTCPTWPGVQSPSVVPGAVTTRLTQLTGDTDPDGLFHVNRTSEWDAPGIDLGANVEHDGRTYIFFGDASKTDACATGNDQDPIAYIESSQVPVGTRLATARRSTGQIDAFYIGNDGALYTLWSRDGEDWRGPMRLSGRSLAPPGAPIATAFQTQQQLDVFVVGNDGGVHVAWVAGNGTWGGPQRITHTGVAPLRASLVAAKPTANELDVFFVDAQGALRRTWVTGTGTWIASPQAITANGVAPAGAGVAAIAQDAEQLDVFFVGNYRKPIVVWARNGVGWSQNLHQLGGNCTIPPGAPLVAAARDNGMLEVLAFGDLQAMCTARLPSGQPWSGPNRVSNVDIAQVGSELAVLNVPGAGLDALFVGHDGALMRLRSPTDVWVMAPSVVGPASHAIAGSSIQAFMQLSNQKTAMFVGVDGIPKVSWDLGGGSSTPWQGPASAASGTYLTPVWKNGRFYPFTIRENGVERIPGTAETPTGAFSWGGHVYVFAVEMSYQACDADAGADASLPPRAVYSTLTRSATPDAPVPFDAVFRMSGDPTAIPASGKFFQVAPVVVSNADVPGLPKSTGQGVVLFGHGWDTAGVPGVHLAWLELVPGQQPSKSNLRYYTGVASAPWSTSEADAVPIIRTQWGWTSISAARLGASGRWVVVTQRTQNENCTNLGGRHPLRERIVAHFAATPQGIASATPRTLFDPQTTNGSTYAYGYWMHDPTLSSPQNDMLNDSEPFTGARNHPSFAYGAYLLGSRSQVNPQTGAVTLEYLLSSGRPYAVQLMRTQLTALP